MSEFKQFRRKQIAELRPFQEGEQLSERVSVSQADKDAGSPKKPEWVFLIQDIKLHTEYLYYRFGQLQHTVLWEYYRLLGPTLNYSYIISY